VFKRILIVSLLLLVTSSSVHSQSQVLQVFNSRGVQIGPGKYLYVNFHVDVYLKRSRLAGNVMARGGGGNDIVVQLIKDGRIIYDSGQLRSIVLSIPLNEPGNYSLILSNRFSIISSKVVWGYVNLYSDGEDTARTNDEITRQALRESVSREILNRLYNALQSNEREWYTRQVPIKPSIFVTRVRSLNAHADVLRNSIYLDLGLFEAAESLGARTSVANAKALLAGVIGHELAHIFFRHPGDRSSGLWGELTGALPIDRKQEQQADVLGTFLACQAGYGSEGLANFMRLLISREGNGSDFGSTHPNSRRRIAMIEQVARRCPATGR
jgi:hypothetical protein